MRRSGDDASAQNLKHRSVSAVAYAGTDMSGLTCLKCGVRIEPTADLSIRCGCGEFAYFSTEKVPASDSSVKPDTGDKLAFDARVPDEVKLAAANPKNRRGKFILVRKIGSGGMGEVYKAWDTALERLVAVKFVGAGAAFLREARASAKLEHENIVPVYDVGTEDDPYISLKFIEGETLDRASLTLREKILALRDAALAIAYAHSKGVIHRDLKPQNIMIESASGSHKPTTKRRSQDLGRRIYVMDFGLARQTSVESSLSQSGLVVGTPSFMPPEQARGRPKEVDERSDIYSLGATLYMLLCGIPPFVGDEQMTILEKVIRDDPPRLRKLNASIPVDLETIAMKCLEKEKQRRYQSALEVAQELQRFLDGEPILARPVSFAYRMLRWTRRHALVVSAAAVSLVVTATLAFLLGILPRWREAARDREALRKTLAAKRDAESRFRRIAISKAVAGSQSGRGDPARRAIIRDDPRVSCRTDQPPAGRRIP